VSCCQAISSHRYPLAISPGARARRAHVTSDARQQARLRWKIPTRATDRRHVAMRPCLMLVARELPPDPDRLSPDEEAQPRKLSIPAGKSWDRWRDSERIEAKRFPDVPMYILIRSFVERDRRNWRAFSPIPRFLILFSTRDQAVYDKIRWRFFSQFAAFA
jgi:hypothetical protein